jgi:hypothetical protein
MKPKQFWVFTVIGGKNFALNVKGNPTQQHHGETTVMKFLCSDGEAESTQAIMEKYGGKVTSHSPRESDDQKEMRDNLLSISGDEAVFPCELCPTCSWFDPYLPGLCGAGRAYNSVLSWEPKVLEAMLEEPKHKKDYDACLVPLK